MLGKVEERPNDLKMERVRPSVGNESDTLYSVYRQSAPITDVLYRSQ